MADFEQKLDAAFSSGSGRGGDWYRVNEVPPGTVGYKILFREPRSGMMVPDFVVPVQEGEKLIRGSDHFGASPDSYVIKVEFPQPGQLSAQDVEVEEWGKSGVFPKGTPAILAGQPGRLEVGPGNEAIILVPCKILDVYAYAGDDQFASRLTGDVIEW